MRKPLALVTVAAAALLAGAASAPDPLAAEIQKWTKYLASSEAKGDTWEQVKGGAQPLLNRASDALHDGRRLLALQRLAAVWGNLEAAKWASTRDANDTKAEARLEAEWKRLHPALREAPAPDVSDLQPAAVRALAETAIPQARNYYDASFRYAQNTMPDSGFFYLGAAQAERKFVDFARSLSTKTSKRPPSLRPIDGELEALQHDLLEIYRPPVSIDRHGEFIGASSMLKEARELNAAGYRYGALVRYLDSSRRTGQLRAKPIARGDIVTRLRDFQSRIMNSSVDHSIAQIYLESAQSDLATPNSDGAVASSVVTYVLPHYFDAIGPAASKKTKPPADVTVTLIRWPYT
jgi:hypothetical protein